MSSAEPVIREGFYAVPEPILRTWAFLRAHCPNGFEGTMSTLHLFMAETNSHLGIEGGVVSRRSLPYAVEQLEAAGMITVRRVGHYINIRLVRSEV